MKTAPLGSLTAEEFLQDYWQKQPLLLRNALPGFQCPLSPDELAGLACEAEIESRIILEKGGDTPWQCRYGPFEEQDFAQLPASHWTLLIQECNKYHPELALLLDKFSFIPNWRIDDVMLSYAPVDGSVGPHIDQYDVFLIQGLGQRRWQIHTQAVEENDFIPGLELRILKHFIADEEWILNPGDMLYLPPGVAHYGVALDDCITLSVGFRAPSFGDFISSFIEHQLCHLDTGIFAPRYSDPELKPQQHPGEITLATLDKVEKLIRNELNQTGTIERWFGSFATEPKYAPMEPLLPEYSAEKFLEQFKRQGKLYRSEYSRFSYIRLNKENLFLYVDGEESELPEPLHDLATLICNQRLFLFDDLADRLQNPANLEFFTRLTNAGKLVFPYDE